MSNKNITLYSTIAILLGAGSVANADVDVYGKLNATLQNSDEAGESEVELRSNASRFGVKGNEALGDGLKAIYQFEWEIDPTDNANASDNHIKSRNQFVGLQGSFGTLKVGRHDTALKTAQGDFDLFNDLEGDIKNVLNGENRESNFIGYTTPTLADAFSMTINLIPGEDAAAGNDGIADGMSVSLNYETDSVYAAIAQDSDIDGADVDTTRVVGGYKFGAAVVNAIFQQTDIAGVDADAYGASFGYKFGDNMIKLQHLQGDIWEIGGAPLESQSSIGLDHKLAKSTKLFGFYTTGDIGGGSDSNDYFGVGIEHKF